MKVLIACECSGIVREAFNALGHYAVSCDLKPTEIPGRHYRCDVRRLLTDFWDLMIAHPPCEMLTVSNTYKKRGCSKYTPAQAIELEKKAVDFFLLLAAAPIKKKVLENPIGIMSRLYKKPSQIIQPWQFGHPESKATCLWIEGLPLLQPTKYADWKNYRCRCGYVFPADLGKYGCANCGGHYEAKPLWDNMTKSGQNKLPPSANRAADRAKTYTGIAQAMAAQWGGNILQQLELF